MMNRIRALAAGIALLCPEFSVAQTSAIPKRARLVIDFGFDYFGPGEPRYTNRLETPADRLVRRVKEFWSVPSGLESAKGHLVAAMAIDEKGVVSDISIIQPSPIDAFNTAATNALAHLNPTPLSPEDLPTRREQVTATFYINEASTPGRIPTPSDWPPPGVFRVGNDVTRPALVTEVKPKYTRLAMKAGITGPVLTEVIVQKDGNVGKVIILRSLDQTFGLDREAIIAASQWKFSPGTRMGEPVDVVVSIELTFTLR
jgi:TonB family protein